jgi:hypothetical protein
MEAHPGAIVALTIAIYLQLEPRRLALEPCKLFLKPPRLRIVHQSVYGKPPWFHGLSLRSRGNRIKSKKLDLKDRFLHIIHILFSHPFSGVDPDPGSGAFLTPGSGIGFFRIPDPKPIFFHPSLLLLFLDPGSEIRNPGSGIRDG